MEKYKIENEIRVLCLKAETFAEGICDAHRDIARKVSSANDRKCFGISYQNGIDQIIYKAALEEAFEGESEDSDLESFVIRKGIYISEFLPNYADDIRSVGKTFQQLLDFDGIDPEGYCLEIYEGDRDMRCLVPLDTSYEGELKMANDKEPIVIETTVNAPKEKVWEIWTGPEHIKQWNSPSDDWHTTAAANDLKVGGKFSFRMEAKDGSFGFDFGGVYTDIGEADRIDYTLEDDRKVSIIFEETNGGVNIIETFEPEDENPVEMQKDGWQAILDNFKKYIEK